MNVRTRSSLVLAASWVLIVAAVGTAPGELIPQDVDWTSPVNVSVSGNTITKTSGDSAWNAGAASTQMIEAGTPGYVEATALETDTYRMFGFSDSNPDSGYVSIDYAIYLQTFANLGVYENGAFRGHFGTYAVGDVLRVERTGTSVTYLKNGSLFYTSLVPSSSTLMMDASIYHVNGTVGNAVIAVVPEPSTFVLLGMGAMGLVASAL